MIYDLALHGGLGIDQGRLIIRKRATVARIKQTVADYYDINVVHMTTPARDRNVVRPRQVAMYLTREILGLTWSNIGRMFGDRDHTTVIHATKKVKELCSTDRSFAEDVEVLRERLA